MKIPAEAIAEWKAGSQLDRAPLLRRLVEFDSWVPPLSDDFEGDVFGPLVEDMLPLQLEDERWFYVLCSSSDATEVFSAKHGPSGFGDRGGWEIFATPWQSAKEWRIDPGTPHEFVIEEADFPQLRALAEAVAVERAWKSLREGKEYPSDLALVARYGGYHLGVAKRDAENFCFCEVANDDGRNFIALFTHADALALGWPEIAQRYADQDAKQARVSGPEIFPTLANEPTAGFVINYHGPTEPAVFSREAFDLVVAELEKSTASSPLPAPTATEGPSPEEEVTFLSNKGVRLTQTDHKRDAEDCLRRALALADEKLGADHPATAICLNNLGDFLSQNQRLDEAEPVLRRAVAAKEKLHGPDALETGTALSNLALVLRRMEWFAEAESMYRRVLPIFEQGHGPESIEVASVLNNLAQVLQHTGRGPQAEPLMRRVIGLFEKHFGENHPNVAIALNNLARLLEDTARRAEAEPLARRHLRIFQIFENETGDKHASKDTAVANYGDLLMSFGLDRPAAQARIDALLRGDEVRDLTGEERTATTATTSAANDAPDFDRLSKIADDAGASIHDQDALFGAAFRLKEWHFIARGEMPNVRPYIAANPRIVSGAPMVKAFTDTRRLHAFAKENSLTGPEGDVQILSMPVARILPTMADLQDQGATHIHFNADNDSYGYYIPLVQLPIIRAHLEKHGLL